MNTIKTNTEVVIINPKDYNLDENQGIQLRQSFNITELELKGYLEVYNLLINSEITDEVSIQSSELRKKLVKVRTNTDKIRKGLKEYHLKAGQFIDATAKIISNQTEIMETKLSEIENFKAIQLKKQQDALKEKRFKEIEQYNPNLLGVDLGVISEEDYQNFKNMVKLVFEDNQKKAQEDADRLHKQNIYSQRERQLLPYSSFSDISGLSLQSTEDQFQLLLSQCISAKQLKDDEIVEMKAKTGATLKEKVANVVDPLQKDKVILNEYRGRLLALNNMTFDTPFGKEVQIGLKSMNTKVIAWLEQQINKIK